ncbi:hypothetical protein TNCV_107391 [Trichonephila clavipes]|nr:hypothetical protein TNCV_107391 [Trichonephila clavipes]
MGGVDKVDINILQTTQLEENEVKNIIKRYFSIYQALYKSFVMYNSAGGAKNNMNYKIAIVEQNKPNVQLPRSPAPRAANWSQ